MLLPKASGKRSPSRPRLGRLKTSNRPATGEGSVHSSCAAARALRVGRGRGHRRPVRPTRVLRRRLRLRLQSEGAGGAWELGPALRGTVAVARSAVRNTHFPPPLIQLRLSSLSPHLCSLCTAAQSSARSPAGPGPRAPSPPLTASSRGCRINSEGNPCCCPLQMKEEVSACPPMSSSLLNHGDPHWLHGITLGQ